MTKKQPIQIQAYSIRFEVLRPTHQVRYADGRTLPHNHASLALRAQRLDELQHTLDTYTLERFICDMDPEDICSDVELETLFADTTKMWREYLAAEEAATVEQYLPEQKNDL